MRKANPLLLIGLGAGLYYGIKWLAEKTGTVVKQHITLGSPKARNFSVGTTGVSFKLEFPLTNNLPFDLPENSFIGQLVLTGNSLASVNYAPVAVPSGESKIISTDVNIKYVNLASNILTLVQNPSALFNGMRVQGNLTSNGVQIPVNEQISLI